MRRVSADLIRGGARAPTPPRRRETSGERILDVGAEATRIDAWHRDDIRAACAAFQSRPPPAPPDLQSDELNATPIGLQSTVHAESLHAVVTGLPLEQLVKM